ncbi:hypothetical protein IGW14_38330 [Streptomyces hygroscopicus subsp. hygroscopicus]|uniref:hypothetical protein n=1 Tax=Streptomyces hygroscopicus TaxID=1912 RepID=UPI001C661044|nr:hypothetical protein [Streptomyces hygroscopicus]MBW8093653.1 hypothetical protein [Streptomyces hygroscopicus subsp. hygroscopicus]
MAEPQSNAPTRADAGVPTSGVIHVRTRLTADFTVIANALAQRRGSAVTIGVAAYISSLPDGTPVSIAALCEHFTEGEILISRALRELEAAGYLERRRVRGPVGVIRTRTYFYDVPGGPPAPTPPRPRKPRPNLAQEADAPEPEAAADTGPTASPPTPSLADADERAVAILASLRIADPRLILSRRDVAALAPAVTEWLAAGVGPAQITRALTTGLPDRLLTRPARILAFRLGEAPLPVPAPAGRQAGPAAPPGPPPVLPWRTCHGCDRAFRSATGGRCRDCRAAASGEALRAAC